ncbi:MAG: lycopene cyclase domain-containing protein [Flavobacteriales bacterium]|nr:lycopene cyclase domain-containing protein [Flavobacteriales bacterium]
MATYLWLDLGALLVPLLFTFHPKIRFDKEWRFYIPAILLSMMIYIVWDVWFTVSGVWGFNDAYLIGWDILHLPVEEWLFFICIPYACLFTHHCMGRLLPEMRLPQSTTAYINIGLILTWVVLTIIHYDRLYTLVNYTWAIIVTGIALRYHLESLSRFLTTYLVILAPFFLVNGILTGALYPEPIVWYDNTENMGKRFLMPLEDYTYAYTMLLVPIMLVDRFKRRSRFDSIEKKA